MEDDIDIYADLPNFNLQTDQTTEKNQACTCEELKKELNSVITKLEDVQKRNKTLEKNLSSLLKTAKAEITRKDKMINDLRMRLDNATFRRNNNKSVDSSMPRLSHKQGITTEKCESIIPSTDSKETEFEPQAVELHHDEYTSQKQENDFDRIPITVFGERLHKKIMESEKEEKKQKALLKFDTKTNTKESCEECIMESDKENGSQSNINSNNDKSDAFLWNVSSGTSCIQDSGKRTHDESDTYNNKRLKVEDPEGKVEVEEIDYNSIVQYDIQNNSTRHDLKNDFATFDDRLSVAQSFKEEQEISFNTAYRTSEYEDMKQDRSYINKWREEERVHFGKNYGNSRTRRGSVDSSKSSRTVSTASNINLEEYNSGYRHDRYIKNDKKNEHRNSSSNYRSYSRKKGDYEWSKNYYLREKPSEMYRERKYNDYKFNNYYKAHRSKRSYDSKEDTSKFRCSNKERANWRDKSRHSSSDVEDRESRNNSRNSRKCENRIKSNIRNISNERLYKGDKTAEIDLRTSSRGPIINSVTDYDNKNIKQHNIESESGIETVNSAENTPINNRNEELYHLEEGEILDSPTSGNKNDFVPFDKNKEVILLHKNSVSTIQLKKIDIDAQKVQIVSSSPRASLMTIDHKNEIVTLVEDNHNCKNDNDMHNPDKNLNDSTTNHVSTDWVCDSDSDDDRYQICDQELENSIPENIAKFPKIDDLNIKNSVCELDNEDLRNTIPEDTTKVEGLFTKNINSDNDKNQLSITNETSYQKENNIEIDGQSCLTDHDYIQNTAIDSNITSTLKEMLVNSESCKIVSETGIIKNTNAEEIASSSSLGARKTTLIAVKNKNDKQNKGMVISRRRKAVTLSDNNASMTILMNIDTVETSPVTSDCSDNDSVLKPRLAKLRASVKTTCK